MLLADLLFDSIIEQMPDEFESILLGEGCKIHLRLPAEYTALFEYDGCEMRITLSHTSAYKIIVRSTTYIISGKFYFYDDVKKYIEDFLQSNEKEEDRIESLEEETKELITELKLLIKDLVKERITEWEEEIDERLKNQENTTDHIYTLIDDIHKELKQMRTLIYNTQLKDNVVSFLNTSKNR